MNIHSHLQWSGKQGFHDMIQFPGEIALWVWACVCLCVCVCCKGIRANTIYCRQSIEWLYVCGCVCVCAYLEGSHAELDTEAQVNAEVVGQKIEEHVVGAKQGDEEEGGLSQASVAHKEGEEKQEVKLPRGTTCTAPKTCKSWDQEDNCVYVCVCVCLRASVCKQPLFTSGKVVAGACFKVGIFACECWGNAFYVWKNII